MNLASLFKDPPPAYAFELSEAGIATADVPRAQIGFHPLTAGTISVSPLRDNILMPDELAAAVRRLAPMNGKRREAALILPDYCARVAVLDFDSFPADRQEKIALGQGLLTHSVAV